MEVPSLYRTFSPTFNAYTYDGAGRDMYIGYNNGGFWNGRIPPGTTYDSSSTASTKYRIRGIPPQVAPFRYYSDGSGRDSYIIFNSGGLKKETRALKEYKLKDFLRTPQECIFEFKPNNTASGATWKNRVYVSKNQLEYNQHLKKNEKGLIRRLYTSEKRKFIPLPPGKNPNFKDTSYMPSLTVQNFNKKKKPVMSLDGIDQINNFETKKKLNRITSKETKNTYLHYTNYPTDYY